MDKVAHLPELRFALGESEVETTTIDNAASALEKAGFFVRKFGTDGYRIHHQATLRKVVSDRRASLDEETETRPAARRLVESEFSHGAAMPVVYFPENGDSVQDSPRLTLVVLDPAQEWSGSDPTAERIGRWTRERGNSPRLYPGALVWCAKKPGRDLLDKVEVWLAWKRVEREVAEGVLGPEYERTERSEIQAHVRDAEEVARDEVWAGYRFVSLADAQGRQGLKTIDLGAGHASASETLCGRIVAALKSEALLNDSVGAGYIDRHWPPAFKDSGAWPLTSLRQSFLNGALTRLMEPDAVLRKQIVDFVSRGDFGLASGGKGGGQYERVWYRQPVRAEEVVFEADVYLLTKARAEQLLETRDSYGPQPAATPSPAPGLDLVLEPSPGDVPIGAKGTADEKTTLRLVGTVPPGVWNRLGTKLLPKLRSGEELELGVQLSVKVNSGLSNNLEAEIRQILVDLSLSDLVRIDRS